MPFLTHSTPDQDIDLYFEDYGHGQPVILIHGWPLSHRMWEQQVWKIVESGYRCITYDRRGFGNSDAPWEGYDYTSLASDLHEIIEQLELEDVILVGFSMGGGEVVRYCRDYGTSKLSKIVLVSSIIPLVAQKEDNPEGVPQEELEGIMDALEQDRVGFIKGFSTNFYNAEDHDIISDAQLDYDWTIASWASPRATIEAAKAWAETDFRDELEAVDVPALVIHGDADKIVPIETSGQKAAEGLPNATYEVVEGGPHGLHLTHRDIVNERLVTFFKNNS